MRGAYAIADKIFKKQHGREEERDKKEIFDLFSSLEMYVGKKKKIIHSNVAKSHFKAVFLALLKGYTLICFPNLFKGSVSAII